VIRCHLIGPCSGQIVLQGGGTSGPECSETGSENNNIAIALYFSRTPSLLKSYLLKQNNNNETSPPASPKLDSTTPALEAVKNGGVEEPTPGPAPAQPSPGLTQVLTPSHLLNMYCVLAVADLKHHSDLSIHPSIHPSIYPPIHLSIYPSIYPYIYPSIYLSIYIHLYIYLYIYIHLYICISIYLSIYIYIYIHLPIYPSNQEEKESSNDSTTAFIHPTEQKDRTNPEVISEVCSR